MTELTKILSETSAIDLILDTDSAGLLLLLVRIETLTMQR